MAELKNPLELYKLLKKSNCGECRVPSCMAFAVAVVQGQKTLSDCPYLDKDIAAGLSARIVRHKSFTEEQVKGLQELQRQVAQIDFATAPGRLGATLVGDKLAICCLGKDFFVAPDGRRPLRALFRDAGGFRCGAERGFFGGLFAASSAAPHGAFSNQLLGSGGGNRFPAQYPLRSIGVAEH
ncbi:MAG: (Fe-S)-binding protein [Deltaproteobacteria bacterium]